MYQSRADTLQGLNSHGRTDYSMRTTSSHHPCVNNCLFCILCMNKGGSERWALQNAVAVPQWSFDLVLMFQDVTGT